ncbi:MAG TPA: dihydrodipicolinate synthase family protein [Candidatus Pullichristensenella avicola]|nr:dihydrodipicolinate synthase family protein [Candidatus Pullichristensenella avicola]
MKKLYGVITAMTTPFDEQGKLDLEAMRAQTEFLIEKGVNCLYPCGTTGEMFLCSEEERKAIAETVVKTAAGRVTVFVHVGAMTQEETIRLARHAEAIGADGIGVVTPTYFNVDDRAMAEYYKAICKSVSPDFSVYAYAIPQLAHNGLSCEALEQVCAECPNMVGIKFSLADMTQLLKYQRVNGGKFSVVFGADHLFLSALVMGCDGTVSGCSGPFPEPFVEVYKKYLAGDLAGARAAQDKANDLVWLMKSGADMSIFKNILTMRGIPGGHMRRPLLDLSEEDVAELRKAVAKYI